MTVTAIPNVPPPLAAPVPTTDPVQFDVVYSLTVLNASAVPLIVGVVLLLLGLVGVVLVKVGAAGGVVSAT